MVSLQHGKPMVIRSVPGHFYNIALTTAGPVKVDLSAVQFEWAKLRDKIDEAIPEEDWDEFAADFQATIELVRRVARNPFSAITVEQLPKRPLDGIAISYDASFDYALAKKYVARLRKGTRRDAMEEIALLEEDPSALATLEEGA